MNQIDFYEFAGIVAPGAIILFGLSHIFPQFGLPTGDASMSIGELGLFAILSFAAGHIIQVPGDFIEKHFWRFFGGMPTDWVPSGKGNLLADEQLKLVPGHIRDLLEIPCDANTWAKWAGDKEAWGPIVLQIYGAVAKARLAQRVDAFNRTMGLLRGMTAGFLVMALATWYKSGFVKWKMEILLLVLALAAFWRMYHFALYYAREIFVQFLNISPEDLKAAKSGDED